MKIYEQIINNPKLTILTQHRDEDVIQIRANYNDPVARKSYWCKFTKAQGWEHLTVSGKNKVPDWDVMCKVKDIFWDEEECCIEYHPRKSQYINNNEYCLHIWRPDFMELPEPPLHLLGIQGMSSEESSKLTSTLINNLSLDEKLALADKIGIKINRKLKRGGGI